MPLPVQCPACGHRWSERATTVGQRVLCPQCDKPVRIGRGSAAVAARPAQDGPPIAKLILIGGIVVLVGVVSMLGFRLATISSDDSNDEDAAVTQSEPTESVVEDSNSAGTNIPEGVNVPLDAEVKISESGEATVIEPTTAAGGLPKESPSQTSAAANDSNAVPSIMNTDRGRELMAAMNDVGLRVVGFSADVRGMVADAVSDSVTAAIQRCQLTVRPPTSEPLMVVELQQKDDRLIISAVLTTMDNGRRVRVWERSGTVTPLDSKATSGGLLPPNLERDVVTFFTRLRAEFLDARRQFAR